MNGRRTHHAAPGDTLELGGLGWPSDREDGTHPPGLSVSLSGHGLLLVESAPDRLVVRIPEETPLGPSTLEVWVERRGEQHGVEVPLRIVDPTWGAEDAPGRPAPAAAPPAPARPGPAAAPPAPAAAPAGARLGVTSCGPVQDAAGSRLEARGTAPPELPDGFFVEVSFRRGGQEVGSVRAVLRGGAWSASVVPVAQALELGRYEVVAVFELSKQPRVLARRFRAGLPPNRAGDFERLERRETFTVR